MRNVDNARAHREYTGKEILDHEIGKFVSGCEALIDAHNGAADIERVCTHSGFRKRGFARAVIQECLYRLRDMGLKKAYITGYSTAAIALYASLGTGEESTSYIYEMAAP